MRRDAEGWFEATARRRAPGAAYGFVLDDGLVVPDPAARAQVGDVHGPSRLVDPAAYRWRCDWRGRPWAEAVIYELHVGDLHAGGHLPRPPSTKLPHLAEARRHRDRAHAGGAVRRRARLGLRRRAALRAAQRLRHARRPEGAGRRGARRRADGVPRRRLQPLRAGRELPAGLRARVLPPRARRRPGAPRSPTSGRRCGASSSRTRSTGSTSSASTACGSTPSTTCATPTRRSRSSSRSPQAVRERLPRPPGPPGDRGQPQHHPPARARAGRRGRGSTPPSGTTTSTTSRTSIATGETEGYYADFAEDHWAKLARALAEGFAYQGEPSRHHDGAPRGVPSAHLPPLAFIDFLQNHDQVGNRAFGERLIDAGAAARCVRALTAILLLSPHVPLLFMGEEWGETRPFAFFTDFDGDLADAVREGRRREFRHFAAFARRREPRAASRTRTTRRPSRPRSSTGPDPRPPKAGNGSATSPSSSPSAAARSCRGWRAPAAMPGAWSPRRTGSSPSTGGSTARTLRLRANLTDTAAPTPDAPGRAIHGSASQPLAPFSVALCDRGAEMSALDDLAARYAIQRSYYTIDGREFRPPPETLKALLAAFGVRGRHRGGAAGEPRRRADRRGARAPRAGGGRLPPARLAGARPRLGPRGAALPAPLGAQLGHRRLRRPRRAGADGRGRGRRLRRPQPAARAARSPSRAGAARSPPRTGAS